jgi:hypothetical protein
MDVWSIDQEERAGMSISRMMKFAALAALVAAPAGAQQNARGEPASAPRAPVQATQNRTVAPVSNGGDFWTREAPHLMDVSRLNDFHALNAAAARRRAP